MHLNGDGDENHFSIFGAPKHIFQQNENGKFFMSFLCVRLCDVGWIVWTRSC